MKIEYDNDKIIIFLYKQPLYLNDIEKLNKQIKNLFIKLIKNYKIDFFGFFKVIIYNNPQYGSILEIEKINDSDFNHNIIDLKIIVIKNVDIFLEFDDNYFIEEYHKMIYRDGKYYLNIKDISNIMKYLEFGKIIYQNNS